MPMIVPNVGAKNILRALVVQGITVHLYTNEVDVSSRTLRSDFVEVVGGGYEPMPLEVNRVRILEESGEPVLSSVCSFKLAEGVGTIRGYFACMNEDLLWVEDFAREFVPTKDRPVLELILSMKLKG